MTDRFIKGRLAMPTDELVKKFGASVTFDLRLAEYDIQGSLAHARMLNEVKIITNEEYKQINSGLAEILKDIKTGCFQWSIELEDVHMNIEHALVQKIGTVGKKLHTGRSRNDQVATDLRLWLADQINSIIELLKNLTNNLLDLAETHAFTIIPGFTHLQVAQPITFGHHMMAWVEMLQRDIARLKECLLRVKNCPLGASALAGTTFPINRYSTALELFDGRPCANSLDAVSDRDFAIEFVSNCSILMMHLSRFSEEIILWSSAQFNFIKLPDSFCTGSSIMPQKKNPDVPELVRGKTGRVYGHLVNLLTLMKAQALAYNKDNQEDKEPLFDTVDTVKNCLQIYVGMVAKMEVNQKITYQAALQGYATATDLADYLVRKGETFRDAHKIVGEVVAYAVENAQELTEIPLAKLSNFSTKIKKDVFECLSLEGSVNARNHFGATAPEQVLKAIAKIRQNEDHDNC